MKKNFKYLTLIFLFIPVYVFAENTFGDACIGSYTNDGFSHKYGLGYKGTISTFIDGKGVTSCVDIPVTGTSGKNKIAKVNSAIVKSVCDDSCPTGTCSTNPGIHVFTKTSGSNEIKFFKSLPVTGTVGEGKLESLSLSSNIDTLKICRGGGGHAAGNVAVKDVVFEDISDVSPTPNPTPMPNTFGDACIGSYTNDGFSHKYGLGYKGTISTFIDGKGVTSCVDIPVTGTSGKNKIAKVNSAIVKSVCDDSCPTGTCSTNPGIHVFTKTSGSNEIKFFKSLPVTGTVGEGKLESLSLSSNIDTLKICRGGGGHAAGNVAVKDVVFEDVSYSSVGTLCIFNGKEIPNGQTTTAYRYEREASIESCMPEERTCNEGILSGTYRFNSCNTKPFNKSEVVNGFVNRWLGYYSQFDHNIFSYSGKSWGEQLAWNLSYSMDNMLDIYDISGDERIISNLLDTSTKMMSKRDSVLRLSDGKCVTTDTKRGAFIWLVYVLAGQAGYFNECYTNSALNTSIALGPVARLVRTIEGNKLLSEKYGAQASALKNDIDKALTYYEDEIRAVTFANGFGSSNLCPGCSATEIQARRINLQGPTNMQVAQARVYAELSYASSSYAKKMQDMNRTILSFFTFSNGIADWKYWPAYYPTTANPEDVNHGSVDVWYINRTRELDLAFTDAQVSSLSQLFVTKMPVRDASRVLIGLAHNIAGRVVPNKPLGFEVCGFWIPRTGNSSSASSVCKELCGWDSTALTCTKQTFSPTYPLWNSNEAFLFRDLFR
jgi:hypothetical protein